MHCSVMGREALEKAIACHLGQTAKKVDGEIVCECFGVTDREIERVVRENRLKTIEDVTDYVKAGGGCGKCHDRIQATIDAAKGGPRLVPIKPKVLTNIQKIKLIEESITREINPTLSKDAGRLDLVDVDGNRVLVRMDGEHPAIPEAATAEDLGLSPEWMPYFGRLDGKGCYTLWLGEEAEAPSGCEWIGLRELFGRLSDDAQDLAIEQGLSSCEAQPDDAHPLELLDRLRDRGVVHRPSTALPVVAVQAVLRASVGDADLGM
jgi:bacterioferritin-associated ferredoxin